MKTIKSKILIALTAVAIGTAFTTSAQAGISFRINLGVPYIPPPRVVFVPAPVVYAPAPVCEPQVVVVPQAPACAPAAVIIRTEPFWSPFGYRHESHHHDYDRHERPVRYEDHWHGGRR